MKSRFATCRNRAFALFACGPILAATILLTGNARAADTRPVVQAELVGVAATWPMLLDVSIIRAGGGARFGEHVGVTGDATLIWGRGYIMWPLVPTATVFWDFDPDSVWVRRQVYFKASWCFLSTSVDAMDFWEGVKLSLGASYTWHVVTPHVEVDVLMPNQWGYHVGGTAGITIGGTYLLQPRAKPRSH